jgi:iron(III) transport system permease protein
MKFSKLYNIKRDTNKWSIILLTIVLFVSIPVLSIVISAFDGPGESWRHILKTVLPTYLENSFWLVVGTSILTLLLGISSAWIVSRYSIPFKKQLEWLLILPLAIPSYITAYSYAGFFDYGGFFLKISALKVDIMNIYGLVFVLSVSLYPYIYVASRAFFVNQSNNIIEASKLLGASERKTFFKLILPLSRPAFVGGLILVLMEVLNDYGAAKYFGVNTFTTGIFRAWFSLEEPETAIYLSVILLVCILLFILIEKRQRKNIGYSNSVKNHREVNKIITSKNQQYFLFLIAVLPFFLGFIIPVAQLFYWAFLTYKDVFDASFLLIAFQSLGISFLSAILTVFCALVFIFASKWNRLSFLKSVEKIGVLGYAIPGAIIAIGILIPSLAFDKALIVFFRNLFDVKIGFILNGTIIILIYAFVIRYLAVAYSPIEASSLKQGSSLVEASKLLGKGNLFTFFKVEFATIKPAILSGCILVFVDVMKELPLTLILKPYNINTLAVKAYEYASDELIAEAAIPSLCIIFTGILPIIFLNRLISKS